MTPTSEQIKKLKQTLRNMMIYRETYEEVYDHIISALAVMPNDTDMGNAINNIINNDFGGYKKLHQLERTIKKTIVKETLRKYTDCFLSFFKLPALLYTIGGVLAFYYLTLNIKYNNPFFEAILIIVLLTPSLFLLVRYFKVGYVLCDYKKSAVDRIYRFIAHLPIRLYILIFFFRLNWVGSFGSAAITFMFAVLIIHTLTIIKLYKEEFKYLTISY